MSGDAPILEFDAERTAIIEPSRYNRPIDVAEHCVITFFQDVINGLEAQGRLRLLKTIRTEIGQHPLYQLEVSGRRLALIHPGVGAPLAAALFECVIARGCRKFVVCGGAGVLDSAIVAGHAIVLQSAVRDEGTSYHYLPPSREVEASPAATEALEAVLRERRVPLRTAKSWTTDAIFRETREKIRLRREEGCIVVEMEAAALFAVARFRGVTIGQVVYAGDDVGGADHDQRAWTTLAEAREQLFWASAAACLRL